MDVTYIELEGAVYQPETVFPLDNFWIIPVAKNAGALEVRQCKVLFTSTSEKQDIPPIVDLFVFCYQFLFLRSDIYYFCSLQRNFTPFMESGANINEIAEKLFVKYGTGGSCKLSFDEIDTFYTQLPQKIGFTEFYNRFTNKYKEDESFRNIIDLFLYTIGSRPKYYNNIFQKISQFQTVFETIMGTPEEEVLTCGKKHFKEEWKKFLTRKLNDKGIKDEKDIELIIKIKNTLNWSARVKYAHSSQQFNTWQKTLEEIRAGNHFSGKSEYTTDFDDILTNTLKVGDWTGVDWDNVYFLYQVIIKRLIYLEYLNE